MQNHVWRVPKLCAACMQFCVVCMQFWVVCMQFCVVCVVCSFVWCVYAVFCGVYTHFLGLCACTFVPLMWLFSSARSMEKMKKIQDRALRFLYDDHNSSYEELLGKSEKCTMHVNRLRYLCIEIFKTVNQLNPEFMQKIFVKRISNRPSRRPNDLQHYRPNQATFGSNSLRSLGPQIWNRLPDDIKSAENLAQFKRLIKNWDGATCRCNVFLQS